MKRTELKKEENLLLIKKGSAEFVIDMKEWCIQKENESFPFLNAEEVRYEERHTEIEDVLTADFENILPGCSLKVNVVADQVNGTVRFQLIPLRDEVEYDTVLFPGTINNEKGKLVLPFQQGILLDTEDPCKWQSHFDGCFACADAYVNALGYYGKDKSFLWIVDSYHDAFYHVIRQDYQQLLLGCLSSLAHTGYIRTFTLIPYDRCADYNEMASGVRKWYEEHGTLLTLKQKIAAKPKLKDLVGSCVYHTGIHSDISPDSRFYHFEGKNEAIVPIEQIEKQLKEFHAGGIGRIHLHMDGCGIAYDRKHPRFYPIDERTGGYPALIHLLNSMHEDHDLLTIHDNYHDLYLDSPDFDEKYQIFDRNGKPFFMAVWAGGKQSYMTAQVAPAFFARNLDYLKEQGVVSDGVYCDVFTCNPLDENFDRDYRQDRRTCAEYRNQTFDVENARGGIVSSEEVSVFAINHIDTCHYAPYAFMMREDGKQFGEPIPFFNLIFHDCLVIPWMTNIVNGKNYGLYALLNGGIPYLKRDGAYVNTDGSFSQDEVDEDRIRMVKTISALHEKVACARMISHSFIDGDPDHQKTVFDNGISVEINLKDNTYQIFE